MRTSLAMIILSLGAASCAPGADAPPPATGGEPASLLTPDAAWNACATITPGKPAGVCTDFGGNVVVADTSPPRLIVFRSVGACQEFQIPDGQPAFRPSDVSIRGFFVYAVDETDRMLLRWDSSGSFRDVLLNFEDLQTGRRISPYGLDVDSSGRLAITDVENHKVLVLDTYLNIDVAFGNYGTFDGQFDTPLGVSFTPRGELLVADSGNGRLQVFSDSGSHRRTLPGAGVDNPMRRPRRAVAAEDGTVYVADPVARCVFVLPADGGAVRAFIAQEGAAFEPTDVALGREGRLFVTDAATQSLRVFKVM
ncbi:MAG: NHL repeat-containing protein [Candidatus Krumholzibacteria bacterium]|nr:NHL repeat-containing protein [Candidatus Krumholzibacteria bacterium]MDH4336618.1 NHL repeat-containing protein [Candidatus Krumholzibacteria bacterium]MDH5268961.1 NHL repeat-containing protein [Candidatus Krumholzibacteria bacterium]